MIVVKLTNKWFYTFILGLFFLLTIVGVFAAYSFIPNPGHGADTVWIEVEGEEMSLQEALDAGFIFTRDDNEVPLSCEEDKMLQFNSESNEWECADYPQPPNCGEEEVLAFNENGDNQWSCVERTTGIFCGYYVTKDGAEYIQVDCSKSGVAYDVRTSCPQDYSKVRLGDWVVSKTCSGRERSCDSSDTYIAYSCIKGTIENRLLDYLS